MSVPSEKATGRRPAAQNGGRSWLQQALLHRVVRREPRREDGNQHDEQRRPAPPIQKLRIARRDAIAANRSSLPHSRIDQRVAEVDQRY